MEAGGEATAALPPLCRRSLLVRPAPRDRACPVARALSDRAAFGFDCAAFGFDRAAVGFDCAACARGGGGGRVGGGRRRRGANRLSAARCRSRATPAVSPPTPHSTTSATPPPSASFACVLPRTLVVDPVGRWKGPRVTSEDGKALVSSPTGKRPDVRPDLWGRPHCKGVAIGVARRGARRSGERTLRIPPSCSDPVSHACGPHAASWLSMAGR